jgi:choline dehydrogenase-like flavoprotein
MNIVESDVTVIGAGAAGITLALDLEKKGFKVNLFEGGEESFSDKSQNLYSGSYLGRDLPFGLMYSRMRFLGGSTNCWGAGCGIFTADELKYRDWVYKSSWPINYNEIVPFYSKASEFFDLPNLVESENSREKIIKGFQNPGLYQTKKRNFKREFGDHLKKSKLINVFLGANYKSFDEVNSKKSINKIIFIGYGNNTIKSKSKKYVLSCGGIDNARILLNSRKNFNYGIGNSNDLVGRYFSDHPITPVASVIAPNNSILHSLERLSFVKNTFTKNGINFLPFFKIPDQVQKDLKILNAAVSFQNESAPLTEAQLSAWSLKKRFDEEGIRGLELDDIKKVIINPVDVARGVYERKTGGSRFGMRIQMEQEPNFYSRIMLSNELDRFGHNKTLLDWRFTQLDRKTLDETIMYTSKIFSERKYGLLKIDKPILTNINEIPNDLRGGQHHSGTTRMAKSNEDGVVDRNLKVFGTDNLYVLGSSVFPTNGWVNPTFTIAALSLRLSEHIYKEN